MLPQSSYISPARAERVERPEQPSYPKSPIKTLENCWCARATQLFTSAVNSADSSVMSL